MSHRLEILARNSCLLKRATQSEATNYPKYFKPFPKYLPRNESFGWKYPDRQIVERALSHILTIALSIGNWKAPSGAFNWIDNNQPPATFSLQLYPRLSSPLGCFSFLFCKRTKNFSLSLPRWYGNWNTKARAIPPPSTTFPVKTAQGSPYLHSSRYCGNCHKKNKNGKWLMSLKQAHKGWGCNS